MRSRHLVFVLPPEVIARSSFFHRRSPATEATHVLSLAVTTMPKNVWMNWEINNKSGWGVLGLNIFFQWARDSVIVPLSAAAIGDDLLLFVDPLRLSVVSRAIKISNDFVNVVIKSPGAHIKLDATVIDPISQSDPPSDSLASATSHAAYSTIRISKVSKPLWGNSMQSFAPRTGTPIWSGPAPIAR